MGSKKRTIGILIVIIVVLLGFAGSLLVYRNNLSSENKKNNSNNNTAQSLSSAPSGKSIENFYDKPITDEKIALDSIEVNRNKLGYSDKNFTFKYDETSSSKTAYHFDLYYKDIPVFDKGVGVFTHYDNNAKILMTSVSDSEKIIKVNTTPEITEDEALNIAKETLGENFSEYNIGVDFKIEKIKPKLTIYNNNNKYNLAYYIQSDMICVVNAESGDVIDLKDTLNYGSIELEGQNGDVHQVFFDDYEEENLHIANMLYDREKHIYIFNNVNGIRDYIPENVLTLDEVQSGQNKSAVDAMANTYRAVEYYSNKFNMKFNATYVEVNDVDKKNNSGGRFLQTSTGYFYANIIFGKYTMKSQDSCRLDDVGHEYTHAVTNLKVFGNGYSKDSQYYEKNALMEAYSDIFGQLIEQEYTGKTDWVQSDTNRNLRTPEINNYRKRKKVNKEGTEWNDYGKAHDNSTIISHTAYLMSKNNDNSKYDNEILLDYKQLGQLWFGSLEYLKETEFKNFSDCRYAIEFSAKDLIEQGILPIDSLKVIQSAFDEVEVETYIHPMIEVNKIPTTQSEKSTLVVPIEDETQSTEFVEITEVPTEPALQISAVDLIDKTIPEIISLMNGEYQIIKTENDGYIYIQNQSVLSGMEFYISVSGDDIVSANNGEEIHSDTLKAKLESGELTLDGIQVNKSGKITDSISVGMDYKSCSKELGNFDCIGGSGGYLSGSVESVSYTYNDKNAKVILHFFDVPSKILSDLTSSKISSVSAEQMKSYNPKLENVVIKKNFQVGDIVSLSLGNGCSGCIDNNGNLYMWGDNSSGKLGNGTTNGSSTPIKIMDNVKEVNLGYFCSSAITEDGSLYMWGGTENSLIPVKIMDNVKTVSFGSEHSGAITKDGSLYMWGSNKHGKLGNGTTNDSLTPVKIIDNVKSVSLSSEYSGAITEDGSLYMWGGNWCYQLGDGTRDDRLTPVKIMDNVKTVTLGSGHNAVITENGSLYMWGYNDKGQVGNGTTAISPVPVESPVKIMENVKAVSLGSEHSGAITEDGSLYMWGNNFYNQLGYKTAKSSTPTKVMDNIKSISFVGSQSSAITENNILYMWGRETNVTENDVLSVSIGHFSYGDNHYGIIKTDGSLYMWGDNNSGEIGNGESGAYINVSTPIKIKIRENYYLSNEQIINSINKYLQENWCRENQYYCFEEDLTENNGYLWVCIRWDGSNSANAMCGSDIKIDKTTGEAEISFLNKPYECFNFKDYQ